MDDSAYMMAAPPDLSNAFDAVAKITFALPGGGQGLCTGSLLAGGQYVLTSAQCVQGGSLSLAFKQGTEVRVASQVFVNPHWNASNAAHVEQSLSNGSDLALIRLDQAVSSVQGFTMANGSQVGKNVLIAGFGKLGSGETGAMFDADGLHYGYNSLDLTLQTFQTPISGAITPVHGEVYVADFDDGTQEHNSVARIGEHFGQTWASSAGLGAGEALIAGGDAGSGAYVFEQGRWQLAGVNSFMQGPCHNLGVGCDPIPWGQSSYGDIMGSVAVYSQRQWIDSVMMPVPEPQSYALFIAGLMGLSFALRQARVSVSHSRR